MWLWILDISINNKFLLSQGELEFLGDKLLEGGQLCELNNGINYKEVRRLDTGHTVVRFYFITRCFSDYVQSVLEELKKFLPDIIIMNSCVWDLHRYGPHGLAAFRQNLLKLMIAMKDNLESNTLVIWNSALPVAKKCKGGLFLPFFETIPSRDIVEANYYARDLIGSYGHIFLDLHKIFSVQLHNRAADGIHWNHLAHRRISDLLLSQISQSWHVPLPSHFPTLHPAEAKSENLVTFFRKGMFASSFSGSSGFPGYVLNEDMLCSNQYRGIGRSSSSFDLAGGISAIGKPEKVAEEDYRNRFSKFSGLALNKQCNLGTSSPCNRQTESSRSKAEVEVTASPPQNGLHNTKSEDTKKPDDSISAAAQSNAVVKREPLLPTPESANCVKVKMEPADKLDMKQYGESLVAQGMCKIEVKAEKGNDNQTAGGKNAEEHDTSSSSSTTIKGIKRKHEHFQKPQLPGLVRTDYQRQAKRPKYDNPNINNLHPIRAVALAQINQAHCQSNQYRPSAPAGAVRRYHPYAFHYHPQYQRRVPWLPLYSQPGTLAAAFRPTVARYSYGQPSWRISGSSQPLYPYQDLERLMARHYYNRYY